MLAGTPRIAGDEASSLIINSTAITGGTSGSVLFIASDTTVSQDNANFFYDATNHRLKLGAGAVATPSYGFIGDPDTGFYQAAVSEIDLAVDSVRAYIFLRTRLLLLSDSFTIELGGGQDVILTRDAANVLALKNGTAAQQFTLYNTTTGPETADIGWKFAASIFTIATSNNGSRNIRIAPGNSSTNNAWDFVSGGELQPFSSNNNSIGDATHLVANIFSTTGTFGSNAIIQSSKITTYNSISTAGWGVPSIYGSGRSIGQTGAVASVATYTLGAADGSFNISANVNVTTSTAHSFTVTCAYTDETNTARTLTLSFIQIGGGTPIATITNVTGAGPYEGVSNHIRCKASTAITIATIGTFTTVTYNVEAIITQIA